MKTFLFLFLLMLVMPLTTYSQNDSTQTNPSLIGEWSINLRPTPDSEGYYQTFEISTVDGNSFTGTFYGSSIEQALTNDKWDRLYFAFTTADLNNTYYHSGYMENEKLFGMTYCPGRAFAAPWTGIKK